MDFQDVEDTSFLLYGVFNGFNSKEHKTQRCLLPSIKEGAKVRQIPLSSLPLMQLQRV